jgi:hypothetical protein
MFGSPETYVMNMIIIEDMHRNIISMLFLSADLAT